MRNSVTYSSKATVRAIGNTLKIGGIAAPFDEEIIYQGQRERILSQAFDATLISDDDVKLYTDHSYKVDNLLASRRSGNLTLSKSSRGLEYEAILPTPVTDKIQHIVNLTQRGELGASVGWSQADEDMVDGVRNFKYIQLTEISLTPIPAYNKTTVEKRNKDNDVWIKLFKARQEISRRRF